MKNLKRLALSTTIAVGLIIALKVSGVDSALSRRKNVSLPGGHSMRNERCSNLYPPTHYAAPILPLARTSQTCDTSSPMTADYFLVLR